MPTTYVHDQPRQVVACGPGTVDRLPDELRALGARSVALLTSPSARRGVAGTTVRRCLDGLDDVDVVAECDAVRSHAPMAMTEALARSVADRRPDAIVAVGGGSVSDTAKGLAVLLEHGPPLHAHCSTFTAPDHLVQPPLRPSIPVVSIPTTFSGAELTPGAGATDARRVKRVFWSPDAAARVVLADVDLLVDVPDAVLTTTGTNALAHCAEALYSRTASPVTDALAVDGARCLAAGLAGLAEGTDRRSALGQALAGAHLAGLVISHARVGLHHAVCHVLGASAGVPHGAANSVVLPHALAFNADHSEAAQSRLARALADGLGADPGRGAPELVVELRRRIGSPTRLDELGVPAADLPALARDVLQDRGLHFNPKPVRDLDAVLAVLRAAWSGQEVAAS